MSAAVNINLDARSALANLDRVKSAAARVEALRSSVSEAVEPIISAAKGIVQQPGKPDYTPRRGQRKRKKHLRDTIGSTVRIYDKRLVGVVGPLAPAGAAGHLVESGHRMVVGGSVGRLGTPKIKWRPGGPGRPPTHIFAKSAPRAKKGITGGGRVVGKTRAFPFVAPAASQANDAQVLAILTESAARHIEAAGAAGGAT